MSAIPPEPEIVPVNRAVPLPSISSTEPAVPVFTAATVTPPGPTFQYCEAASAIAAVKVCREAS